MTKLLQKGCMETKHPRQKHRNGVVSFFSILRFSSIKVESKVYGCNQVGGWPKQIRVENRGL
uniref:Uncharacterized protein n=1 Tax=Cannabis sativa TaxID=3483 RepID=A0A803RAF5_CANSA